MNKFSIKNRQKHLVLMLKYRINFKTRQGQISLGSCTGKYTYSQSERLVGGELHVSVSFLWLLANLILVVLSFTGQFHHLFSILSLQFVEYNNKYNGEKLMETSLKSLLVSKTDIWRVLVSKPNTSIFLYQKQTWSLVKPLFNTFMFIVPFKMFLIFFPKT